MKSGIDVEVDALIVLQFFFVQTSRLEFSLDLPLGVGVERVPSGVGVAIGRLVLGLDDGRGLVTRVHRLALAVVHNQVAIGDADGRGRHTHRTDAVLSPQNSLHHVRLGQNVRRAAQH